MDAQGQIPLTDQTRILNNEQIQWLLSRLSSDDQKELSVILRDCTSEMTLTRGLPFTAAVLGSLYFARSRLPESLRIGPKRWPFYALIGVGALTSANMLSMNVCTERVRPKLAQLYEKYNQGAAASATRYDQLREQNRANYGAPTSNYGDSNTTAAATAASAYAAARQQNRYDQTQPPTPSTSRFLYDEPPLSSGTPTGSGGGLPQSSSDRASGIASQAGAGAKGTSYGDEGFS